MSSACEPIGPATLLFPGQGSQSKSMVEGIEDCPFAEQLFDRASQILGYDLVGMLRREDSSFLGDTGFVQPAVFVTSLALLGSSTGFFGTNLASHSRGESDGMQPDPAEKGEPTPSAMVEVVSAAGHSLGEYTALVASGMLTFEEGLALVATRGEAMKRACEITKGAMVALLGAEDERVEEACAERRDAGGAVWVANYNSPGQVVISGEIGEAERAMADPKLFGARRAVMLEVAGACHTPLMEPASRMLWKALSEVEFKPSPISVWSNVTAQPYPSVQEVPRLLARQLVEPVRWKETIANLAKSNVCDFVCFGPSDTIAGLARRSLPRPQAQGYANATRLVRIETFQAISSPTTDIVNG